MNRRPRQGLAGGGGVNGREALDPRRQGQHERHGFAVPDLSDDGYIGGHPQEPSHQSAEIDLLAIRTRRAGLHVGHIRQRDVGLEDFLGHHDPKTRIELGGQAGKQSGLARTRSTRNDNG